MSNVEIDIIITVPHRCRTRCESACVGRIQHQTHADYPQIRGTLHTPKQVLINK
jgi:hypothetical protein